MTPRLRHIAVHAEEPRKGRFVWVLTEQEDDTTWTEIQRSDDALASYAQALQAGLHALQKMSDDPDAGPRTPTARRAAGKAGKAGNDDAQDEDDPADPPEGAAPKKSVFGFGPAR